MALVQQLLNNSTDSYGALNYGPASWFWDGTADEPCKVLFRGLPGGLAADAECLEALLEQAGFEQHVTAFELAGPGGKGPVQKTCDLIVAFDSQSAAWACAMHFESCFWGPTGYEARITAELFGGDASKPEAPPECDADLESTAAGSEAASDPPTPPRTSVEETSEDDNAAPPVDAAKKEHASLLVAYFPKSACGSDLKRVFARFGDVTLVTIMRDDRGVSKCFGFLNFSKRSAAEAALKACADGRLSMRDAYGKVWHVKAEWSDRAAPASRVPPPRAHREPKRSWTKRRRDDSPDSRCSTRSPATTPGASPSTRSQLASAATSLCLSPLTAAASEALRLPRWCDIDSDAE